MTDNFDVEKARKLADTSDEEAREQNDGLLQFTDALFPETLRQACDEIERLREREQLLDALADAVSEWAPIIERSRAEFRLDGGPYSAMDTVVNAHKALRAFDEKEKVK